MAATIKIIIASEGGTDKVKKDLEGLGDSTAKAGKGFQSLHEVAVGALRQLGAAALNAAASAAQAFAGFVSDSVAKAGDFEAGMNQFGAVVGESLGESGKSLEEFKDLFIQLGRDLPVSTAEVQQAAIELAKGGIDPATMAAGGLRTALDLAAAGGVGLAESATIMSKQLGVWIDQSADAATKSAFLAQSADLIAQAANASTVDVHELSLGLANVGGMAKASGLSFRETVTTLATVSAGFSSAADAGTSFKTFLARLQPTTDTAAAAMKNLNLLTSEGKSVFYDTSGSFVGMANTAAILKDRLSGLSEAEKVAALQAIFGQDAFRMAAILADKGAEGYTAMAEAMLKAGGVAQQAAARQQGFNTAMDNLGGSLEALQITIGSAVLPAMTKFVNVIAVGVNAITDYAEATMEGKTALAAVASFLADAVQPAFIAVTVAALAWASVNSGQLAIGLALLVQRLPIITAEMWGTAAATAAAAAPFVVLAAAVGGALLVWNRLNSTVKSATTQLLESREWWNQATDAITRYAGASKESQAQLQPYAETIKAIQTQIEGEVESLGKRMAAGLVSDAQYQAEMATINQHRTALDQATTAYNSQELAIARTAAASMTASSTATTLKDNTAALGSQASLTAKDIEDLGKKLQKTYQDGQQAVEAYAATQSTFLAGVETRQLDHNAKITELMAQKALATTAEEKKGIDAQIAQENQAYATSEQNAAAAYAAQQAAQQQHLGQMLIDYTVAQASLGNIAKEKAAEITAALEEQYGLQETSTASTFLSMAGSIDSYANDSGGSIDSLMGKLEEQQQVAADTKKTMDDYATVYTATAVENFLSAKGDAKAYAKELESIPKEVHTRVVTTYSSVGKRHGGEDNDPDDTRATGGPIEDGKTYLVGEKGPELIVPNADGYVVPNDQISPVMIGQGGGRSQTNTVNTTLNFAPQYGGPPRERMDYALARSLAGV